MSFGHTPPEMAVTDHSEVLLRWEKWYERTRIIASLLHVFGSRQQLSPHQNAIIAMA